MGTALWDGATAISASAGGTGEVKRGQIQGWRGRVKGGKHAPAQAPAVRAGKIPGCMEARGQTREGGARVVQHVQAGPAGRDGCPGQVGVSLIGVLESHAEACRRRAGCMQQSVTARERWRAHAKGPPASASARAWGGLLACVRAAGLRPVAPWMGPCTWKGSGGSRAAPRTRQCGRASGCLVPNLPTGCCSAARRCLAWRGTAE